MFFKDLVKEYSNKFTVAYLNIFTDDLLDIYLTVYPTRDKSIFEGYFRVDKNNAHVVFDDKGGIFYLDYLEKFHVVDFH